METEVLSMLSLTYVERWMEPFTYTLALESEAERGEKRGKKKKKKKKRESDDWAGKSEQREKK